MSTATLPPSLPKRLPRSSITAALCRKSFSDFVREFWEQVPGAGKLVWNWHLDLLCDVLQEAAERVMRGEPRLADLIFNVPFGTSKSTVISILFPAWVWTKFPEGRFLTATHTDKLVRDLSAKSRTVITGEKYKTLFPGIELLKDSEDYFRNNHGGDRNCCTVGGKTPTGFHANFILCLPWESRIITECGVLPIGRVVDGRLPLRVLGHDVGAGRFRWQRIMAYEKNPPRPLCRVSFADGRSLEATADHPVYVRGRGYVPAAELSPGDEVVCASVQAMRRSGGGDESDVVEEEQRLLRCPLSGRIPAWGGPSAKAALPGLWKDGPPRPAALRDLLQWGVPVAGNQRTQSPAVRPNHADLFGVWGADGGAGRQGREELVLQQWVPGSRGSREEALAVATPIGGGVRALWDELEGASEGRGEESLLFSELCQQSPLREDVRSGKPELHSRNGERRLYLGVSEEAEVRSPSRGLLLSALRDRRNPDGTGIGRASRGLGQSQQSNEQLGRSVSGVSHGTARACCQKVEVGSAVVTSVEQAVRIPTAVYNVRTSEDHNYFAEGVLVHNCDDPIDPQGARSQVELDTAAFFVKEVIPSRKTDKAVSLTVLIMQRLDYRDPTAVMEAVAREEGAVPVRKVCLPGELTDKLDPPLDWLRGKYGEHVYGEDGLLDPARLSRSVLASYRATLTAHGYSAQVLQDPRPPGGGMFKPEWFAQRVRAAPYNAKRVRYWDRASTQNGGCFTAGVLLAKGDDGRLYVEHVARGQWEPNQRNDIIVATAQRDKDRYGPRHAPVCWIEAERGSTGLESYQHLARRLMRIGVRVREDVPSGSKDTRAEPWADQLAAKNVWLVEDGTWDIAAYVEEHLLFRPEPGKRVGGYKDQVDGSSGADKCLRSVSQSGQMRMIPIKKDARFRGPRLVVCCGPDELRAAECDLPALLVRFADPEETYNSSGGSPAGGEVVSDGSAVHVLQQSDGELPDSRRGEKGNVTAGAGGHGAAGEPPTATLSSGPETPAGPPPHGLTKCLETVTLTFADLDPAERQDSWGDDVPPLLCKPEHARKMWGCVTRPRGSPVEVIVFADAGDGDRRALSAALAVCDVLRLPRKQALNFVGDPERVVGDKDEAPNPHVQAVLKRGRELVT